jgi:hypothetical protein
MTSQPAIMPGPGRSVSSLPAKRAPAERSDALGIITKSASPLQSDSYSKQDKRTYSDYQKVKRYAVLAVARYILSDRRATNGDYWSYVWRVASCRKQRNFISTTIDIKANVEKNTAWISGVCVCGSVHTCAVCAYTVGQKKGKELSKAIEDKNCSQAFLVATIQHKRQSDAKELYAHVARALSSAMGGKAYQKFAEKWKLQPVITGWEWTGSLSNGHHPHKNILFLSEMNLDNPEFESDLDSVVCDRYKKYLSKKGFLVNAHTTKILTNKKECANYMTKWALSLEASQGNRKSAKKGHLNQFELLYEIG